ncbi:hypothetical protein [Celeribacter sp.]|uniref:hypothetical protein n=1 Tax=Celeribacter sp. TaxID=1890673 RepID=UPI003A910951
MQIRAINPNAKIVELSGGSDRILVSRLGRVVEEFSPSDATEEKIMYAAVH